MNAGHRVTILCAAFTLVSALALTMAGAVPTA